MESVLSLCCGFGSVEQYRVRRMLPNSVMSTVVWRFVHGGLTLLAMLGTCLSHCAAADFYVATNGNNTNLGTLAQPFKTLESARDAIRKVKTAGSLTNGATVWIRGGLYERDRTFELGSVDSGTPAMPITYSGYGGETPRIVGGKVLTGFKPVTDPAILGRLPAAARTNVLEADLKANGVTNFGTLKSRGYTRPWAIPAHLELFVNGTPATLARWPNTGEWEHIAGFPSSGAIPDSEGGTKGSLTNGFNYSGDRPNTWSETGNIWVHGYWCRDWADTYEQVASIDTTQRLLKTSAPYGIVGFRTGQRFYFLNVLEELDQPGEYYVDTATGRVFLWSPTPIATTEVVASVLEGRLATLWEASYIQFANLSFEATRSLGIYIGRGTNVTISGTTIRGTGNHAVEIGGGQSNQIISCKLEQTGEGGVVIAAGDRQTLTSAGHLVQNCWFHHQGRWVRCYVPAVELDGVGHRVVNNLIEDGPHAAIVLKGNEHVIEYNEIRRVALETGDVGAIYACADFSIRGNIIRYNFFHDINGPGLLGSSGVYMDGLVSGVQIYGNVFNRVQRALFLNGGRDHTVENNVFLDCSPSIEITGLGLDPTTSWSSYTMAVLKSLLAVPQALYVSRYPALSSLYILLSASLTNTPGAVRIAPENNILRNNICVGGTWAHIFWYADPTAIQLTNNYAGLDPGFINPSDPSQAGFQFRTNSLVWELGFKPIPFVKMGLQPDALRQPLQSATDLIWLTPPPLFPEKQQPNLAR